MLECTAYLAVLSTNGLLSRNTLDTDASHLELAYADTFVVCSDRFAGDVLPHIVLTRVCRVMRQSLTRDDCVELKDISRNIITAQGMIAFIICISRVGASFDAKAFTELRQVTYLEKGKTSNTNFSILIPLISVGLLT